MDKVEENLVSNNIGKNVISASKILELTLEDYHQSRKIYDNKESRQLISQQPHKILQGVDGVEDGNNQEEEQQNIQQQNENNSKNNTNQENNQEKDKLSEMKSLTFEFIKENELSG